MLTITSYLSKTLKILSTFVVPFLITYGGLLAAILKDWKNVISHGNQAHTDEPTVTQLLTDGNVSAEICSTNVC